MLTRPCLSWKATKWALSSPFSLSTSIQMSSFSFFFSLFFLFSSSSFLLFLSFCSFPIPRYFYSFPLLSFAPSSFLLNSIHLGLLSAPSMHDGGTIYWTTGLSVGIRWGGIDHLDVARLNHQLNLFVFLFPSSSYLYLSFVWPPYQLLTSYDFYFLRFFTVPFLLLLIMFLLIISSSSFSGCTQNTTN